MSWAHGFLFLSITSGLVCLVGGAAAFVDVYDPYNRHRYDNSMKVMWCFLASTLLFGFLAAAMLGGGR